jgi:hypothetical protein
LQWGRAGVIEAVASVAEVAERETTAKNQPPEGRSKFTLGENR